MRSPTAANTLCVAGLLLLGGCQKQLSLQAMQPLHQQQDIIAARLAAARVEGLCAGAMLLSTCNRFEVVFDLGTASADELRQHVFAGIDLPLTKLRDIQVVQHLIRVSVGLESLVLGEDQIIGQIGQAFRESEAHGLLGKRLHMLHSRIMHAARKARSSRPTVSAPRSVAALAARIARDAGPRIAIIGAGSTAQTAAESLREFGARELHFANRTAKNATRLADHFDGSSGSLDDLLMTPPNVDAVIVAISGRKLRIPVAKMPGLQTVVDLSQPAVATGLEEHAHVRHLDLDGLAQLEQQREIHMETWCRKASALASEDADRIWSELQHGRVDLGQLLGLHVENAVTEADRALRGRLRGLEPEQAEEVKKLAERVARRNAHLHLSDVRHFVQP